MEVDTEDNEKSDEISDYHVSIEPAALNIPNGEHAEDIAFFSFNVVEVVGNIDGYENSTSQQRDASE